MDIRKTKTYKTMTPYLASAIAEGFLEGENSTQQEKHAAWQWLVDTGEAWHLQGWYGRNAHDMIENGLLEPPIETRTDYYGNKVVGTKEKNKQDTRGYYFSSNHLKKK